MRGEPLNFTLGKSHTSYMPGTMSTKFHTVWKIYFWFCVIFVLAELIFKSFWHGAFQFVGLIGLYGFVWRARIGNPIIWQIYLIFMFIELGYLGLKFMDPALQEFAVARPQLSYSILALFIVINGPLYYALIRYASPKHKIWVHST
jgi:uncharacterized membrane protein